MKHESRFDKYAAELEQDLEDGFLTRQEFRADMRELIEEFAEENEEEACE
jgi:hypothetical protein